MKNKVLLALKLSLLGMISVSLSVQANSDIMRLTSVVVEKHAENIFYDSKATGMALVVIDNNQVVTRNYGETRPGNGIRPNKDSLIRIASITKLMTSQVMVKLEAQGRLKATDPLRKFMPIGGRVPDISAQNPIRLYHLATHTSGLPREQPGRPQKATVFTFPTHKQRWQWLKNAKLTVSPGSHAAYSNLAYDLLADALSVAARKPYPVLFQELITRPLGMRDTTFTPSPAQCARLMVGKGAGPCKSALAAIGSGGVYSTPADMQRWMQQFLASGHSQRTLTLAQEHKIYFKRSDLLALKGMDVPGQADGLGLGWVYMKPTATQTGMLQKTGGGGGFITYMALVPEKNIGVFVVVTRSEGTRFKNMSDGVNRLITDLARSE